MKYRLGPEGVKHFPERGVVTDINLMEANFGRNVGRESGRQIVYDTDAMPLSDQAIHEVRPDETSSTCYKSA